MPDKSLYETVRQAWLPIKAAHVEDMQRMDAEFGSAAARAFIGIAPTDVDLRSPGFHAATPLVVLPPHAAAVYLGTYLLSLLEGLEFQQRAGFFDDLLTRAHTVTCLSLPWFWRDVIREHLPPSCQDAVKQVAMFLCAHRDAVPLTQEQVDILQELANCRNV